VGGITASVQPIASYLGLGEEGEEVEVDGGLLPRGLTAAAFPLPPHAVPGPGSALRRRGSSAPARP
jgi:hypothetical protein